MRQSGIVRPLYRSLRFNEARLEWSNHPRNILIYRKSTDPKVTDFTASLIDSLSRKYPLSFFVEPAVNQFLQQSLRLSNVQEFKPEHERNIDLVVTLGGDGTVLRAASQFSSLQFRPPPILSYSMGTLGFVVPFEKEELYRSFSDVYHGRSLVKKRERLSVKTFTDKTLISQSLALNDFTIHRGSSPHLTYIDVYVDGRFFTTTVGDGLTISTPAGSTAYSLSAGGSIVHPNVPSIMLTPICPRSLSFRPIILPLWSKIAVRLAEQARGPSEVSVDGQTLGRLQENEELAISVEERNSLWFVSHEEDVWIHKINQLLGFNSVFGK